MKKLSLFLLTLCLFSFLVTAQGVQRFSSKLNARSAQQLLQSSVSSSKKVQAYIRLSEDADLEYLSNTYHVHFNVQCGNNYTVLIPQNELERLSHERSVEKIMMQEKARIMMDSVRISSNVEPLYLGEGLPQDFKGKGILVGVVDTGFDFTHPNFKDKEGKCRILNVWDQNKTGGEASSFQYGSVYSNAEAIAAAKHDASTQTHGTHVAGILAGSHKKYRGIAPESELVLVSTNMSEQGIVDGVAYLVQYAQKQGRPISINVSLGTMLGFKDGTGLMAQMLDSIVQDKKGVLLSLAVGNEGNRASTLMGKDVQSVWLVPKSGADQMFIETVPNEECEVHVQLINKVTGLSLWEHTFKTGEEKTEKFDSFGTVDKDRASFIASCSKNPITEAYGLSFNVGYSQQENEEWRIRLISQRRKAKAYCNNGSFSANGNAQFVDGETRCTVAMTACGHYPIAVGAFVSKNRCFNLDKEEILKQWEIGKLYPKSAKGPTSDWRVKPDIVAPGAMVVSSYNSFAAPMTVKKKDVVAKENYQGKNYFWYIESGTSMACPVVAGIMALWLEAKPTLSLSEVKNILHITVNRENCGTTPNHHYGYGKIDALAGIKEILKTSSIKSLDKDSSFDYQYYPSQGLLHVEGAKRMQVFSINGKLITQIKGEDLQLQQYPSSSYIVRIERGIKSQVIKIIR